MANRDSRTKRSPNPNARTPDNYEADLVRVCHLYLSGETQESIATIINVSQGTVSNDLKLIRERWKHAYLADFNEIKNKTLARIDWLEIEAVEGYKRSQREEEMQVGTLVETVSTGSDEAGVKKAPNKKTTKISRKKRDGSDKWFQTIRWCVEQRCQIFGLYANKDMSTDEAQSILDRYAEAVMAQRQNDYQLAKAQADNQEIM